MERISPTVTSLDQIPVRPPSSTAQAPPATRKIGERPSRRYSSVGVVLESATAPALLTYQDWTKLPWPSTNWEVVPSSTDPVFAGLFEPSAVPAPISVVTPTSPHIPVPS